MSEPLPKNRIPTPQATTSNWLSRPLLWFFTSCTATFSIFDRYLVLPSLRWLRWPFKTVGDKNGALRGYSGILEGIIVVFLLLGVGYDAPKVVFGVIKNAARDGACGAARSFEFGSWCGAQGQHASSWGQFGLAVAGFLLFAFLSRWILAISGDYKLSYANVMEAKRGKARVLIMGLSVVSGASARTEADTYAQSEADRRRFFSKVADFLAPLGTTAKPPATTAWQQNARMIAYHLPRLEAVFVLPSDQSIDCVGDFEAYCGRFFGSPPPFSLRQVVDESETAFFVRNDDGSKSRNYESYDYNYQGIVRAVQLAKSAIPDLKDSDICLDTTAGSKTFSIASAMLALNEDLRLGYVTSGLRDNRVLGGEVMIYQPKAVSIADLGEITQKIGRT